MFPWIYPGNSSLPCSLFSGLTRGNVVRFHVLYCVHRDHCCYSLLRWSESVTLTVVMKAESTVSHLYFAQVDGSCTSQYSELITHILHECSGILHSPSRTLHATSGIFARIFRHLCTHLQASLHASCLYASLSILHAPSRTFTHLTHTYAHLHSPARIFHLLHSSATPA
jgi:hypothetical protein